MSTLMMRKFSIESIIVERRFSELLKLVDASDLDFASEKSAASLRMIAMMLVRGNYEVADRQIRQVTR